MAKGKERTSVGSEATSEYQFQGSNYRHEDQDHSRSNTFQDRIAIFSNVCNRRFLIQRTALTTPRLGCGLGGVITVGRDGAAYKARAAAALLDRGRGDVSRQREGILSWGHG